MILIWQFLHFQRGQWTILTFILLTWRIWWAPNNVSKWQMGFNSAFKGLRLLSYQTWRHIAIDSFTSRSPYVKFLLVLCDILISTWVTISLLSFRSPSFLPSFLPYFLRLVYLKVPVVLTPASEFSLTVCMNNIHSLATYHVSPIRKMT